MTSDKGSTELPEKKETPKSKEFSELSTASSLFKSPPFHNIRKYMIDCFIEGNYGQLRKEPYLYSLDEAQIERFFLKEGRLLLSWSLIDASDDEPLKFLIETTPDGILKTILKNNDFAVLQEFIWGEMGIESDDDNPEEAAIQIKKFKALLTLDKEGIVDFMNKNASDPEKQSAKINANFAEASAEELTQETVISQTTS